MSLTFVKMFQLSSKRPLLILLTEGKLQAFNLCVGVFLQSCQGQCEVWVSELLGPIVGRRPANLGEILVASRVPPAHHHQEQYAPQWPTNQWDT